MHGIRSPYGNIARQSFDEAWAGAELSRIQAQFDVERPGIDCEHCVIKKSTVPEEDDDFFFRMIAKQAPQAVPAS
jgi:hypothetical protein